MRKPYQEKRPWGEFIKYADNEECTVKILTINPGEELSYQYHRHRDELWIPLTEGMEITLDGEKIVGKPYQPVFIPRLAKHRASGVGKKPAKWMEISFGKFDEKDEVRLEDRYGRS
jgi:mannose-1-phosphate guanylyltransferase/mannose-6-phosphate isomerase